MATVLIEKQRWHIPFCARNKTEPFTNPHIRKVGTSTCWIINFPVTHFCSFLPPSRTKQLWLLLFGQCCVCMHLGVCGNPLFLSMCAFDSGQHCESELSVTKPLTCQHCRGRVCPTDGLKEQQSGHRVAVASARMHGRPEPTSPYQSFSDPSDWLTYWPPLQCGPFIFNYCVCRDGWDQDCGSLWWS